jgi:hypothetical protein
MVQMYSNGTLKYFIVRTILNMAKSSTSRFFYKYRKPVQELNDNIEVRENTYDEDMFHRLEANLSELHWYEQEVFKLYSDNGNNVLQLSRETKIPYRSLIKTINKVKSILKDKIRNYEHT